MFLGTYEPKLDDKGRLILPAKYREQLADGLVITRGQERCLYVFPTDEFQDLYAKIRQAPLTSRQARDFTRLMLSGASDEEPDRQGRVTIPAALREYAGLERELTVIGVGTRAEIWDTTSWNEYLQTQEDSFADTQEEVIPDML